MRVSHICVRSDILPGLSACVGAFGAFSYMNVLTGVYIFVKHDQCSVTFGIAIAH